MTPEEAGYMWDSESKQLLSLKAGPSVERKSVYSKEDDTFIEKTWDWIEDNILSSNQQDKSLIYYEQFKNYIKGFRISKE